MDDFTRFGDGRYFSVRVTPKAARNLVEVDSDGIADLRVRVTVVPEGGKANAAVTGLLAKALGVAKSRLVLVHGATSRDKVFRVRN
ncbi:MAG: DUF167 domain-containing protein [Rhodobacteraceae bacterium]|nr:DUF167 domain-containing protein [Paracoccaceae bacterium]